MFKANDPNRTSWVQLPDSSERKFIHNPDTMIMKGHAEKDELRVSFGEVVAKVPPTL